MNNPLTPKLIIYGGSFDPPHQGHVDCVQNALEVFPDATIMVIPAKAPAGAGGAHKAPQLSYQQRFDLCSQAFGELGERVQVSPLENELPTPNFTIRTLVHLKNLYPNERLGLLMGQDQLKDFPRWSKPKDIMELASLVVVKRDFATGGFGGVLTRTLNQFSEEMQEPFQWTVAGKFASFPSLSSAIFLIDQPISVASSTMIREFFQAGQPLPDGWLPANVKQHIESNRYYGAKG